ncbi:complement C1q-like protein 2 isoform X2 [Mytilus edulis]|uniref:complement C1q-like protein 2 isoform X2 n=1 Tax=Mytilus edulis TaxID=6550 RepID=UPI0039EFCDA4
MTSAVSILLMIVVIQIAQIFAACQKGLSRKTRPAFTASLTHTKALGSNEVMKFDKIWLNNGGIYNPNTGVFTVPMNGLYLVSSSMMSYGVKQLHCHLVKNGQSNVGAFGKEYSQGTLNAVMNLQKDDKLFIKQDGGSDEPVTGAHWSMFSAYLISE